MSCKDVTYTSSLQWQLLTWLQFIYCTLIQWNHSNSLMSLRFLSLPLLRYHPHTSPSSLLRLPVLDSESLLEFEKQVKTLALLNPSPVQVNSCTCSTTPWYRVVRCGAVRCNAVRCGAMQCSAVQCYMCCAVLCRAELYCSMPRCTALHCTTLHFTMLYNTMLDSNAYFCCFALCRIAFYCIRLCGIMMGSIAL